MISCPNNKSITNTEIIHFQEDIVVLNLIKAFFQNESGQGITEYGAVMAFIGILIAFAFSTGNSSLYSAIKGCFSSLATNTSMLVSSS